MENESHKQFLIALGKRIKYLREQQGISRVQMAYEMSTDEKQLRLIERGDINTGVLNLFKITQILEIEPKELLDLP